MNKHFAKIISAFSLSAAVSLSSFCYTPVTAFSPDEAEKSISELEDLKEENKKKIADLEQEIEAYQAKYDDVISDENDKTEYRNALTEKMELQSQNIDFVAGQIAKIDNEISENIEQINLTEAKIKDTDTKIDENITLLKKRIRVSYMSSGNSISSILSGSSSFYDILTKFELIARVADHDNKLVETLQTQINELKELKSSLQSEQETLESNLEAEKEKKSEYTDALNAMSEDYSETQEELNRIEGIKNEIHLSIEERRQKAADQEKELEEIAAKAQEYKDILEEYLKSVSESAAVSESVSASLAESEAESRAYESQVKAAEASRIASEHAEKPVTQVPETQAQAEPETRPVTEAPVEKEPLMPSAETQIPESQPAFSGGFGWPIANGYGKIGSHYGPRSIDDHKGVDINASDGGTIMGKAIVAAADGMVITVKNSCPHNYGKSEGCGCGGNYGRYVVIAHSDGKYSTLYAHMSSAAVSEKQVVSKGQIIGYVGATGWAFGPHLHFEVHNFDFQFGKADTYDPENFISNP